MRRLPQHISPGARARRSLLIDLVVALVIALVVLQIAAGLGVVTFFALPLFLVGLIWIVIERGLAEVRRRRHPRRVA